MSFDISCVNKIKLEKKEDFDKSIFSNVYNKAGLLVGKIMDENSNNGKADKDMQFAEENYICNIIAFIGKRGMGKSSAMLSFACSLEKNFLIMPKIDMSMVTKNESLLDIILASMWEKYDRENSIKSSQTDLRKQFVDVKDSYVRFKNMEKKNSEDELYSAKEFKKLAKSLRFRESFSALVEDFLAMMINDNAIAKADRYLVFAIDDLDLVSNNQGEVLEQIKNFLSIPNVIVLTTLDIERSILSKRNELDKQFYTKYRYDSDVDNVMEYASDYIAKIIPFNRRIYMPDIHEEAKEHMIDLDKYSKIIDIESDGKYHMYIDYERFCNLILYKYTGILTDSKMGCIFGEHESLRGIVNGLNELCDSVTNNEPDKAVESWIKKEITVLADRINSEEMYNFYINYSRYPNYRFEDLMVQSIYYFCKNQDYMYKSDFEKAISDFENSLNDITYSDMLAFFVTIKRKLYINDWNKIKNAFWVYSITHKEEKTIDILSRCIRDASGKSIEHDLYLPNVFALKITDIRKEGTGFNSNDYKELVDVIKCMLFTDVKRLLNRQYQIKGSAINQMQQNSEVLPNPEDEIMEMQIDGMAIKISFDSFIDNICNYEERCKELTEWILGTIYSSDEMQLIKINREDISDQIYNRLNLEKWKTWMNSAAFKNVGELFPLQSLGYMVGLAERLDSNLRKEQTQLFSVLYRIVRETITNYMKETEKYYFMNGMSDRKSESWDQLLDIVDIESINEDKKKLMITVLKDDNQFHSPTM